MLGTAESSQAAVGVVQKDKFESRTEFLDRRNRDEEGQLVEDFGSDPAPGVSEDDGFVELNSEDVRRIDSMVGAGQHQSSERRLERCCPARVLSDVHGVALQKNLCDGHDSMTSLIS
jgi:hypothetical protein